MFKNGMGWGGLGRADEDRGLEEKENHIILKAMGLQK